MKAYTVDQIEDLIDYLSFSVGEGYVDSDAALDIILSKDWKVIDDMRDRGDAYADQIKEQDI